MNLQTYYPHGQQAVPHGRTTFRSPGAPAHLEMRRDNSGIEVDSFYPQEDFTVRQSGEDVRVDYAGLALDTSYRRRGDDIEVDRSGFNDDFAVRRSGEEIEIDRPGVQNDVRVRFGSNRIEIRPADPRQTVSLERSGDQVALRQSGFITEQYPIALHPGGWPESPNLLAVADWVGLTPRSAEALDRWATQGVDMDDIIRVDRSGQIYDYGFEFR